MADKTAQTFVDGIPRFVSFIKEIGIEDKLKVDNESNKMNSYDETNPLFGKTIVMSGFRDNGLLEILKNVGAKVGSSVSKNTFIVLVKDLEEDTGKVVDAKKLGIQLMTPEEFKNKYF
jgi:NAD-dependent DNA ligase